MNEHGTRDAPSSSIRPIRVCVYAPVSTARNFKQRCVFLFSLSYLGFWPPVSTVSIKAFATIFLRKYLIPTTKSEW